MQDKSKNTKEGDQGKSQVTAVDSVSSLMHEDKDLKEFVFFSSHYLVSYKYPVRETC